MPGKEQILPAEAPSRMDDEADEKKEKMSSSSAKKTRLARTGGELARAGKNRGEGGGASEMRTDDEAAGGSVTVCLPVRSVTYSVWREKLCHPKITGSRKRLDTGYWF